MKKLLRIVITVLLLLFVGLYGVNYYYSPEFTWRQRMTVEVAVDGEIVSGSSVIENHVEFDPPWSLSQLGRHPSVIGEAVMVGLGSRGYLFALLRSETSGGHAKMVAIKTFPDVFVGPDGKRLTQGNYISSPYYALRDLRETREISRDDYPMLVTFTDIADPKTVQLVDPDNLAATFGEGVSLNRITLEITGDPRTDKIVGVLGWSPERQRAILNGTFIRQLAKTTNRLRSGNSQTGVNQ